MIYGFYFFETMKKQKAIILLSGGLDSCVTAAIAKQKYDLFLLHVNYAHLTAMREKKAFRDIASFYDVKNTLVVDIDYLKQIGGSSLLDKNIEIPDSSQNEIPNTYVPFRNANLLSIAVSWAEVIRARKIFIGAMEEDSSGYPDCRESFFRTYNEMIKHGTKPETDVSIETPILHRSKAEVVEIGMKLQAPLQLTWSCYANSKKACGKCESCKLILKAFEKAVFQDEIPYSQ